MTGEKSRQGPGLPPGTTTLTPVLRKLKPALVGVAVFSFFINILMLAAPLYTLAIFRRVLTSGHGDTLLYLTLLIIFCILVMTALLAVRHRVLSSLAS